MTLAFDASEFHLADSGIAAPPPAETLAWGTAQMESKPAQRRSEVSHGESKADSAESIRAPGAARRAAAEDVRPVVEKWVAVELPRHAHRRTLAYKAVARLFACHESWVRRLIGRQVTAFDADLYKRIMQSEAEADRRLIARHEAELRRLGRAIDGEARDAAP